MERLYREFGIETSENEDWVEIKLNHLFGSSWKIEEEEDGITLSVMERIFINWMKKNHPVLRKEEKNYMQFLDEWIQKKKEWIQLSRKIVFDEWMERRIRRMKRSKENIHFDVREMEKMELQERLDQIEEKMNEMDRSFMRNYPSKIQIEYFNDLFTKQVSQQQKEVKNPFDYFYVNPTSDISDTYSSFEQNDRFKKEGEMNYYEVSKRREAMIDRPEGLTLDNFNEMFEKQKRGDSQSKMSGLDAYFQTHTIQGSSIAYQKNRPMTDEEIEKAILKRSDVEN